MDQHQAWTLRSLLAKLEKQEAEGEDSPNGPAGEFVVSRVCDVLFLNGMFWGFLIKKKDF